MHDPRRYELNEHRVAAAAMVRDDDGALVGANGERSIYPGVPNPAVVYFIEAQQSICKGAKRRRRMPRMDRIKAASNVTDRPPIHQRLSSVSAKVMKWKAPKTQIWLDFYRHHRVGGESCKIARSFLYRFALC